MDKPLVSVLMTTYNRENYIREAIESVIVSSYANLELIITDDCSTDNTLLIAKEYAQKDTRVKVFKNEYNLGDYPNRNKAASYAKGKYLKFLDSDDAIFKDGLEFCVHSMEQYPGAGMGMVFFQRELTGADPACWDSKKAIHHHFFVRGWLNVGPSGTIIRRDVFEYFGGYDTRFGVASDNFFNLRLAAAHPVVLLPREFFFYRVHDGQEHKNKVGYLQYNHLYLKKLLEEIALPLPKEVIESLKKKVQKSFAKELVRHLVHSKNPGSVVTLMKNTRYSFKDMVQSLFY